MRRPDGRRGTVAGGKAMDRKVNQIIDEWRQLEREHAAATNDESLEELEARISERAEEHRVAFERRLDEDAPEPRLLGAPS